MAVIEISAADFPGTALSGSGSDTLKLVGGGMFNFAYVTFAGFAHIECEGGIIKISGDQLAGVSSVSSSASNTSIYLSGDAIDLRGKTFNNVNKLLIDQDGAVVTVDNLPLALRLDAYTRQGETIVLDGPVVTTPTSRADLHTRGFDTIINTIVGGEDTIIGGGDGWTDETPILSGLATGRLHVRESNSVLLDPEGDSIVSDAEGPIAQLDIVLSDSGYYYPMSHFGIAEKFEITSDFINGQRLFCNDTQIATISAIASHNGARISFNASATQDMIQDFVRSLAYTPGDFVHYQDVTISITALDKGGRKAEAVMHVTAEPDWTPMNPMLFGGTVAENAAAGTVVGTLNATDANGDAVHYVLVDNAGGRFKVVGDKLVVSGDVGIDYQLAAQHTVTVVANDGHRNGQPSTFTINVINVIDVIDVVENVPGEKLSGGKGRDTLGGHSGNDTISGGLGSDILSGGQGSDIFVFSTKPGRNNLDKITDFAQGADKISLENAVFKKLGKAGSEATPQKLGKKFFSLDKPKDKNDHVVYNKRTGVVSYDEDGSGSKKAVEIVIVKKGLALTVNDFFVV